MPEALGQRRLNSGYGETVVLEDVDLALREGGSLSVIGRNGVGKTTLLATIMGHTTFHSGEILLGGKAIQKLPVYERSRLGIGYVPQERLIFPSLSVQENLTVAARPGRWSLERVYGLFPVLAERQGQRAGSLSGGEQQMLAVGRALMSRPKLILFDEPSMGLAPVMVLRLFDLIRRVREEGYTILVVEQNVRQVLKLVDRAYLLEVGRIKTEGRAADLAEQDFVRRAYVGF